MDLSRRVLVEGVSFPEGPRWHEGELWFSEFTTGTVRSIDLTGVMHERARLDGDNPSGIGFLPDGTPVVVSMMQRQLLRLVDHHAEPYADLRHLPCDFLNDMIIDATGRAYVGTRTRTMRPSVDPLGDTEATDAIACVEPDGHITIAASGLISPNGMAITSDGGTLLVAETYAQRVLAFNRTSGGQLTDRRVFAELPGRYPDGICLDDDGALWVASPYSHEFVRVLDGGAITDRIPSPGGVACAIGGPDGHTLFLLSVDPATLPAIEGADASARDAVRSSPGSVSTVVVDRGAASVSPM